MGRRTPFGTLAGAALLLSVAAGCASDRQGDADIDTGDASESTDRPTTNGVPPTTRPLSNTDLPTISGQPQVPPKQPTDSFQPFTVRGRVDSAFEPGCIELVTDAGRYVLIGHAAADLVAGDEVEVSAIAAPELQTVCQGNPIKVSEVRRL